MWTSVLGGGGFVGTAVSSPPGFITPPKGHGCILPLTWFVVRGAVCVTASVVWGENASMAASVVWGENASMAASVVWGVEQRLSGGPCGLESADVLTL